MVGSARFVSVALRAASLNERDARSRENAG